MVKQSEFLLGKSDIFFDFDNTVTSHDILDDVIQRFAVDDRWVSLEKAWEEGSIGSKECLREQLRSVRATKKKMAEYCSTIRLDPYFNQTLAFLRKEGASPVILSDNFSFFINNILKNNGIKGIKVYANGIRFNDDKIIPTFSRPRGLCRKCGHCKSSHVLRKRGSLKPVVYVGDGHSDMCVARHADMVLAKEPLLGFCRQNNIKCAGFNSWKDILEFFKGAHNGEKNKDAAAG